MPPLAAPTICFDLRRGCSMAEHMQAMGHRTYLVEYGNIGYSDKELGLVTMCCGGGLGTGTLIQRV